MKFYKRESQEKTLLQRPEFFLLRSPHDRCRGYWRLALLGGAGLLLLNHAVLAGYYAALPKAHEVRSVRTVAQAVVERVGIIQNLGHWLRLVHGSNRHVPPPRRDVVPDHRCYCAVGEVIDR